MIYSVHPAFSKVAPFPVRPDEAITMQEVHELVLISTDEIGTEEWACPLCDMQAEVRWAPPFKRTVKTEGEPGVTHQGRKNGRILAGLLFCQTSSVNSADIDWLSQTGIRWP